MITRYKHRDYPVIAEWYHRRGQKPPPLDSFSDMGWIVDNRVAGWLYLTNSNLAIIEGVISNPDTIPSLRRQSLRVLAGLMTDTAVSLGCTTVLAISKHPSIVELCSQMGFKELEDHKVFALSEPYSQEENDNSDLYGALDD